MGFDGMGELWYNGVVFDEGDEAMAKTTLADTPKTALSRQIAAYDAKYRRVLELDHFGKWAVVYDEELVGIYDSFKEAANDATRQFGRGPYLIREIGRGPIPLPASALYNPV